MYRSQSQPRYINVSASFITFSTVTYQLVDRVLKYMDQYQTQRKHLVNEKQVIWLGQLSLTLRMEISMESMMPLLANHPFFEYFGENMSGFIN